MKKLYAMLFFISVAAFSQNKILFDATKAETAGNADWVVDSDTFNLSFINGPAATSGGGNESNPQRFPTPSQSGITATTSETYWKGALSAWGVDCVKNNYTVETLPYNGLITFGDVTNVQDLSNYKLFIVDEPNIDFSAAEKNAIINFVYNGGSLFIISDHNISDRNNDGIDSPAILNNLMLLNTVQTNPFGIRFDNNNISGLYSTVATSTSDPLLHGVYGDVSQIKYSNGSSMTINTTQNASVKGVIFTTGSSLAGNVNVVCAYATFGAGKVVAIGDSSVPDDGTGDSNDNLYNGYTGDASGNHQKLLMNATIWLMNSNLNSAKFDTEDFKFTIAPNPIQNKNINLLFTLNTSENVKITVFDNVGRIIKTYQTTTQIGSNNQIINVSELESGLYFCNIKSEKINKSLRFSLN